MNYTQSEKANPSSEYLLKLQMIVRNTVFKNKTEANNYETMEYKLAGMEYVNAVLKQDTFDVHQYSDKLVYDVLRKHGYPEERIFFFIKNPLMIPSNIKNELLEITREIIISTYVEKNKYYSTLAGIPFPGTDTVPADEIVNIPDEFYELYKSDPSIIRQEPIHEMPSKYIEIFINSKYYDETLAKYPNAEYLKYIGSKSIPIEVSRPARDGDILKINTSKLTMYHQVYGTVTVSSGIINQFVNSYKLTRDYIFNTLRGNFAGIYVNYDPFIRFLTIYMTIGNALNELMKNSGFMINMSDTTANNFFMLYGLPSVIMEGTSMISFLKKFRMILADKGTNVVYRVKDLVGYEYTDIYTLVMVKQQIFENGYPIYYKNDDGELVPKQEIIFRRLGTTSENTSYFKFRDSTKTYSWQEIASGDPRWWNTPEVEQMLNDMNYTLSNSKYIQLSTHMSLDDIFWQSVILLRGILDNRITTDNDRISINYNIDGTSDLTVFDAVLSLIIMMNWNTTTVKGPYSGELYQVNGMINGQAMCLDQLFNGLQNDGLTPNELKLGLPFKLTSFNFELPTDYPDWYNNTLPTFDYIDPDYLIPMLNDIYNHNNNNIGEVLMGSVKKVYDFLTDKLQKTSTINEFRQVTEVFNKLFLVDPIRDWYDNNDSNTDILLMDIYNLTIQDLESLKAFYYRNPKTVEIEYKDNTYTVSLSDVMNQNVKDIIIDNVYIFRDINFVSTFNDYIANTFVDEDLLVSNLSNNVKTQYKDIIQSKVSLDSGMSTSGPTSFESLLFRHNNSLYHTLFALKSDGEDLIMFMRAIIESLENYTNAKLNGLTYIAIGEKEYYRILKEIITYFKSYMVEFTKEEFVYLFNGLFDNGGNSNMLKLFDEINSFKAKMIPVDSLTLFDVTNSKVKIGMKDSNEGFIYDDAIIRIKTTYSELKLMDYEIWFDDGARITKNELPGLTDDSIIIANITNINDDYAIIINAKNIVNK